MVRNVGSEVCSLSIQPTVDVDVHHDDICSKIIGDVLKELMRDGMAWSNIDCD